MTDKAKFLPEALAGKMIGVLAEPGPILSCDLEALGCTAIPIAPDKTDLPEGVAAFVLDCAPMLGHEYTLSARNALRAYARLANDQHCYGAFPYRNLNYNWDVVNFGGPGATEDIIPGARWIYDTLLGDFAVRAVANVIHDECRYIITRLMPLQRTLVCIMAASGHGKTTFARHLKNQHNTFHTSSDYLLNTIISAGLDHSTSQNFAQLKQAISDIPSDKLWGRFFRLLEEEDHLLHCFLEMVWQHMKLAPENGLLSFDIDLRKSSSKQATLVFFRKKNLKVWECGM